jgi:hypothetical protein
MIALLFAAATAVEPAPSAVVDDAPITRREAVERADRLFDLLDVNRDGVLTRREAMTEGRQLKAQRRATGVDVAPGIGGQTARYFERRFAFANSISRRQFEQAMLAHFDRLDRNHDGLLTAEERADGRWTPVHESGGN